MTHPSLSMLIMSKFTTSKTFIALSSPIEHNNAPSELTAMLSITPIRMKTTARTKETISKEKIRLDWQKSSSKTIAAYIWLWGGALHRLKCYTWRTWCLRLQSKDHKVCAWRASRVPLFHCSFLQGISHNSGESPNFQEWFFCFCFLGGGEGRR